MTIGFSIRLKQFARFLRARSALCAPVKSSPPSQCDVARSDVVKPRSDADAEGKGWCGRGASQLTMSPLICYNVPMGFVDQLKLLRNECELCVEL